MIREQAKNAGEQPSTTRTVNVSLVNATAARSAGETPAQQAKHHEIDRKYSKLRRYPRGNVGAARYRLREIETLAISRLGRLWTFSDKAWLYARLILDHVAFANPLAVRPWLEGRFPELTDDEIAAKVAEVGKGRKWGADDLAKVLKLTYAERKWNKITTIGAIDCGTPAKREARRRRNRRLASRARRAAKGAKPHSKSIERDQPWISDQISRATWFRRRRKAEQAATETRETETRPAFFLSLSLPPVPEGAVVHEVETSTVTAKPLPACDAVTEPEGEHVIAPGTVIGRLLPSPIRVDCALNREKAAPIADLDPVDTRARRRWWERAVEPEFALKLAQWKLGGIAEAVAESSNPEWGGPILVVAAAELARAKRRFLEVAA
jgi:hypothetical protein